MTLFGLGPISVKQGTLVNFHSEAKESQIINLLVSDHAEPF